MGRVIDSAVSGEPNKCEEGTNCSLVLPKESSVFFIIDLDTRVFFKNNVRIQSIVNMIRPSVIDPEESNQVGEFNERRPVVMHIAGDLKVTFSVSSLC